MEQEQTIKYYELISPYEAFTKVFQDYTDEAKQRLAKHVLAGKPLLLNGGVANDTLG